MYLASSKSSRQREYMCKGCGVGLSGTQGEGLEHFPTWTAARTSRLRLEAKWLCLLQETYVSFSFVFKWFRHVSFRVRFLFCSFCFVLFFGGVRFVSFRFIYFF